MKKKSDTVKVVKKTPKVEKKVISNVYSADFAVIDETIENIKKESRKHGVSDYACNNIYQILQDALKKVILSED